MNENYIIVEYPSEQASESIQYDKTLELILRDFANLYAQDNCVDGIQLYQKSDNANIFLILFSNDPDFDLFSFLINYLYYPVDRENLASKIRGFFMTSQLPKKISFGDGDWLMLYVSKNDDQFDNVSVVNHRSENYTYDFGGKIKRMSVDEERFELIPADTNDYLPIQEISPSKKHVVKETRNEQKPWWKFW